MSKHKQHYPIASILFPTPVSAGMNPYILMSLAYMYRATNEHAKPVELTVEGGYYRLKDGRHRVVASMMAGRKTILGVVVR